jgi:hypothetical protein
LKKEEGGPKVETIKMPDLAMYRDLVRAVESANSQLNLHILTVLKCSGKNFETVEILGHDLANGVVSYRVHE